MNTTEWGLIDMKKNILIGAAIIIFAILVCIVFNTTNVWASDPGTQTFPGTYGVDWGWQDAPDSGFEAGGYYWIAAIDPNEGPTTPTDTTLPSQTNLSHEGEYFDPYIYETNDPEPYLAGTYRMPDNSLMVWTGEEWVNVVVPDTWW